MATTTLDALHQRVLRTIWPDARALIETTTGVGSMTSLVIASRANTSFATSAFDGVGVYCPSVTAAPKESYVTRGGFAAASGTFTMSPAYGSSPGNAAAVYFLYGLTMFEIDEAINDIVRKLYLPRYVALTLVTDGDMEAGNITSWPDSTGTPAQTKETSIVLTGTQSLKVVYTVLNSSVRSLSVPVTEGDILNFSTPIKCTNGSVRVQLYDVTNSAEIVGATVDEEDWTEVRLQSVSVPNNCQNIQIRYIGKTTDTTAYVDYAALYDTRNIYAIPSAVPDAADILNISRLPAGHTSEAADSYLALSEVMRPWPHYDILRDYAGTVSHRIQVRQPCADPLFLHFRAPDAVLAQNTSDTDTTFVPVDILVNGAAAECFRRMGDKQNAALYQRKYADSLAGIGLGKPISTWEPVTRVTAV